MAYRGARPGFVGHSWEKDKNEVHMVRDTLSQNACLWDGRHADSQRANYEGDVHDYGGLCAEPGQAKIHGIAARI